MDEIVLKHIGTLKIPNKIGTIETQFKRVNKTHQSITGKIHVKKPFDDSYLIELVVLTRGSGEWTHLVTKNFTEGCKKFIGESGYIHSFLETYIPEVAKKGCPVLPGNYTIQNSAFPRYRKDWDLSFQAILPPVILGTGENFKALFNVYDSEGKLAEAGYAEALFLNKFSVNQG